MSPAERAKAAGWKRLVDLEGREGWRMRDGAGRLTTYRRPPGCWRVCTDSLSEYATEDAALAAALDAVGVP